MKPKAFYIWIGLSILCAAGIFIFSSIEGTESAAASMTIAGYLRLVLDLDYDILNFLVRKTAHVIVFFILSFCVTNAVKYIVRRDRIFLVAWGVSSVYGVLDEIHQYFVPGRVCALSDMLINAFGAFLGAGLAYMLFVRRREQ
ncbi:MAG: VanZ family protein [Defluviitaleaceae bacterium]|nr:VanZ family protein [Defluviitaleaceae bacterium]